MNVKDHIYYSELLIPFSGSAMDVLTEIYQSSSLVTKENCCAIYERQDEWAMAIGCYAEIDIKKESVSLRVESIHKEFKKINLCEGILKATEALPVKDWRIYGCTRFEMSHVFYGLAQDVDRNMRLAYFFVPKYEIRICDGRVLLRSIYPDMLSELVKIFRHSVGAGGNRVAQPEIDNQVAAVLQQDSQESYKVGVGKALDEIHSKLYQKVILSRKVQLPEATDLLMTYKNGRKKNTPARSFLFRHKDFSLAGFSPETLLEASSDGWVSTQPLAGTRAFGESQEESLRLQAELLSDTKELAEHAVSVKLAQDELESICAKGTVSVTEFMSVRKRGSVQHLASRVVGKLLSNKNLWDAFQALFPAVTASGIPKKQAIYAIKRHESCQRGWYSGCVLIADSNGMMDAALTLRSIYKENNSCWLQAGAGIVDLSTPERELEETKEKLECIIRSVV